MREGPDAYSNSRYMLNGCWANLGFLFKRHIGSRSGWSTGMASTVTIRNPAWKRYGQATHENSEDEEEAQGQRKLTEAWTMSSFGGLLQRWKWSLVSLNLCEFLQWVWSPHPPRCSVDLCLAYSSKVITPLDPPSYIPSPLQVLLCSPCNADPIDNALVVGVPFVPKCHGSSSQREASKGIDSMGKAGVAE